MAFTICFACFSSQTPVSGTLRLEVHEPAAHSLGFFTEGNAGIHRLNALSPATPDSGVIDHLILATFPINQSILNPEVFGNAPSAEGSRHTFPLIVRSGYLILRSVFRFGGE